jgi:hypothetical protein
VSSRANPAARSSWSILLEIGQQQNGGNAGTGMRHKLPGKLRDEREIFVQAPGERCRGLVVAGVNGGEEEPEQRIADRLQGRGHASAFFGSLPAPPNERGRRTWWCTSMLGAPHGAARPRRAVFGSACSPVEQVSDAPYPPYVRCRYGVNYDPAWRNQAGRSINGTTRRIETGTVIKPIGARAVGKVEFFYSIKKEGAPASFKTQDRGIDDFKPRSRSASIS